MHSDWVPGPAELLTPRLRREGYTAYLTSTQPNRFIRLLDILTTLLRLRHQIDLVCVQTYSGQAFVNADAASLLARQLGLKLILVLHGGALPEFAKRHSKWVQRVFIRAHQLIAPSPYLAEALRPLGFPIRIIPNAIDLKEYPYRLRTNLQPRLIWMRTFHEIYNPYMAIQVLAQLVPRFPDAQLSMAGQDKGMLQIVKKEVVKLGLEDRINFLGFLHNNDKKEAFARNDIFINTNRVDNTPVSMIEAAAFGLPIVSTNVGGIPYFFENEENALLVPDGDVKGMTGSILRLINDMALAARLSLNGRVLAEMVDWTSITKLWKQVFEETMLQN